MLVFEERTEYWSTRRKTSWSRVENQQQTQPTHDAGSGNRTRDTLVGGEHSHHCDIPAPQSEVDIRLAKIDFAELVKDAKSVAGFSPSHQFLVERSDVT